MSSNTKNTKSNYMETYKYLRNLYNISVKNTNKYDNSVILHLLIILSCKILVTLPVLQSIMQTQYSTSIINLLLSNKFIILNGEYIKYNNKIHYKSIKIILTNKRVCHIF